MSEDLATKVQELIDSTINPAVAGHGGFVQLVEVKDNKVYLQMGGGCQGCGAADVTLKAGKYHFYCSVPGHEDAGMSGYLVVS